MFNTNIRYSRRTCYVFNQCGELVGKIQWQKDRAFQRWQIRFLSETLPVNSYDAPDVVREKLEQNNLRWQWQKIRHYYGYQRF